MSTLTMEEKFNAAVNVIKNLPKDGPYQPSNEMKLRFYSYFKQATEGPCFDPKPAFWEVVKKAKWDAWKGLGDMSKEDAMSNYVEDLKKIIETMSYTENVADFVDKLGAFYEVIDVGLVTKGLDTNGGVDKKRNRKNVIGIGTEDTDDEEVKQNGLMTNGVPNDSNSERLDWKDEAGTLPVSEPFTTRDSHSEKFYSGTESDDEEFSDPVQNDNLQRKMLEPLPLERIANDSGFSDNANGNSEHNVCKGKNGNGWAFIPFRKGLKGSRSGSFDDSAPVNGFHYCNGEVDSLDCGKKLHNGDRSKRELSNGPVDGVARCGGGDLTPPASSGRMHRGSGRQASSNSGKAYVEGSLESLSSSGRLPAAGSGGGHRRGQGPGRDAGDVNEQIAETLFQLQKDMESVLIRLNTLEALTVAHHNIAQGRMVSVLPAVAEKRSSLPTWWPFRNMSFKTVAVFLAWPIVLQMVVYFVMAHRSRLIARRKRP